MQPQTPQNQSMPLTPTEQANMNSGLYQPEPADAHKPPKIPTSPPPSAEALAKLKKLGKL